MVDIIYTLLGMPGDNMEVLAYVVSAAILMMFIDAIFCLFGSLFSKIGGWS